jgi:pyruvate dehydrogenase E1 component alpha subunit
VRVRLLETGRANENDLKAIDKEIRAIVNEAADFAQRDPEPDTAELYTDVLR